MLVPCRSCRRLHRPGACPFCIGATGAIGAITLVVPLLVGCHDDPVRPTVDAAPLVPASASLPDTGNPDVSVAAVPDASPDAAMDGGGGSIGASSRLDGSIATISAYGAAPLEEVRGPVGIATITTTATGADSAVVIQRKGSLRTCYQTALYMDPGIKGSIAMTVTVDPSGAASAKITATSGLTPSIQACMLTRMNQAHFAAGTARTLDVKVACALKE